MQIAEFADRLMARFPESVTGRVFVQIQRDPELMAEYQELVQAHGVTEVNAVIGRRVREHLAYRADGDAQLSRLREALG